MQQPMPNPEDITDPTIAMNMALVLMAKAFKLNYSTPTNNNQRILSNPHNRQIAQSGMNMGQDKQMQMVRGNGGNYSESKRSESARAEGNAIRNNDGLAEVQLSNNCYNNDIFNMFTQEEQYTELLKPIPELHQVQQNDSNVISMVPSVEQGGGNSRTTSYNSTKFVRDFKSLTKEADESLTKHKALELEIERLLRAAVSQDIMSIVQSNSVVDTSNLQTKLECMKERFENCFIKKENEYPKFWNDWYKKCEECKYNKISYDKAYNNMQQKIEWLQAQLGDLKGKCKDTPCVSDTLDPLSHKLKKMLTLRPHTRTCLTLSL
ncbi:hypothetical protein Tco_1185677 [Tanacetum coccineum]